MTGEESGARRVRGLVRLPERVPPEAAAVTVRVEDVSRADAPSVTVGEQTLEHVPLIGGALPFEVVVPVGRIERRARYVVSVHVDVTGSGRVEPGDLITTQAYPVLTQAADELDADEVDVEVRQV